MSKEFDYFTMEEMASALKVTQETIRNYRRQSRFKFVKVGGRYLVSGSELRSILKNGLRPTSRDYRIKAKLDKRAKREAAAKSSPLQAKGSSRKVGGCASKPSSPSTIAAKRPQKAKRRARA